MAIRNLISQATGYNVAAATDDSGEYHRADFDPNPLSAGAMRVAHLGTFSHPASKSGSKIVIKEFKASCAHLKGDWNDDIKTAKDAAKLAKEFNSISGTNRPIHFRDVIPLQVTGNTWWRDTTTKVGEWVVAEEYLEGNYTKWLSNNGWVSEDVGETLPAFAHWTWVETKGEKLVCDLQGVRDPMGYWLTDPAINSTKRSYGKTDIGNVGIHNFFASHKCTSLCKYLKIDKKRPRKENIKTTKAIMEPRSSYSKEDNVVNRNRFVPKLEVIAEKPELLQSSPPQRMSTTKKYILQRYLKDEEEMKFGPKLEGVHKKQEPSPPLHLSPRQLRLPSKPLPTPQFMPLQLRRQPLQQQFAPVGSPPRKSPQHLQRSPPWLASPPGRSPPQKQPPQSPPQKYPPRRSPLQQQQLVPLNSPPRRSQPQKYPPRRSPQQQQQQQLVPLNSPPRRSQPQKLVPEASPPQQPAPLRSPSPLQPSPSPPQQHTKDSNTSGCCSICCR